MTTSERVSLLQNIARDLSTQSWTDIDLALNQFGFTTSQNWDNGDLYGYCVYHLQKGNDESLLELGKHLLGPQPTVEEPPSTELPWKNNRLRLFLSHLSAQKQIMSEIKNQLSQYAIDGFVAHEDIEPTKEWQVQIELALATCDAFAAVLTPGFHESNWTDHEVGFCVARHVLIIPIRLGVDPYGFISRYQALTPKDKSPAAIAAELFAIISRHPLTEGKVAEAIVSQFTESSSFAEAKVNARKLGSIKTWTPDLLREIEQAITNNNQVAGSYNVPETVRSILRRHGR